jgi:predicted dehydrogenase
MLDVGVYSVHEMLGILNRPAKRVFGFFGITDPKRTVAGGPMRGLEFPVTANDNNLVLLDFGDSIFGVVDGTYNAWAARSPRIEIFGREGVLNMWPALNETGGKQLELYRVDRERDIRGWTDVELTELAGSQRHVENLRRALIVEHLVDVVRGKRPNELGLDQARHALEIMIESERASETGASIKLTTTFTPVSIDVAAKDVAVA